MRVQSEAVTHPVSRHLHALMGTEHTYCCTRSLGEEIDVLIWMLFLKTWQLCLFIYWFKSGNSVPPILIITSGCVGVSTYPTWDTTFNVGFFLLQYVCLYCLLEWTQMILTTHMHSHTYTRLHAPTRTYAKSSKHMYNQATRLYRRYGLTPSSHTYTHSLCLTDGTCQDAKTQPWGPASLKWLSARRESSEWASGRLSDFSFMLLSGKFLPAMNWILTENTAQTTALSSEKKSFRRRITRRHHFNKLFVKPETRSFLCGNNTLAMHLVALPHYPATAENIRRRLFFRAIGLAWWAFFPTPSLSL